MGGEGEGPAPQFVIVGRIRRSHGLRGDVVVEPYSDDPGRWFASGRSLVVGNTHGDVAIPRAELRIVESSPFGAGLIVGFEGLPDRETADLWRDRFLLVPAEEVPPAAEGEIHIHDLVGLRVGAPDGTNLGSVVGFYELPQGLMLDVKTPNGEFLLPYRDEFIRQVNRAAGELIVDLPDGFFE